MMKRCRAAVAITAAVLWSASALGAGPALGAPTTETPDSAQPALTINPTRRTYEIEVPLKLDDVRLGDVAIKIADDEKVFVDTKLLKTYLGKVIQGEALNAALATTEDQATQLGAAQDVAGKKEAGAADVTVVKKAAIERASELGQLGQEKPIYVALDQFRTGGLAMRYDPQNLELRVEPTIDQRLPADLSFAPKSETDSASLEPPAYVSAYLNTRMTASYVSQSSLGSTGVESPSFTFDGAVRVGSVVLEGEASFYTGDAKGFDQHLFEEYGFYRRGTQLVYDLPEEAIRLRAGDVTPDFAGFQTSPDLLGVTATKFYTQLQPGKSIRPTGSHSFRVERPSTVDIIVGGALVRRLKLGPGIYNLSDLPLQVGANDIKLVIEDDTGARQTLEFTAFSGYELLAPGLSEWSAAAGVKSLDSGIANYAAATTAGGYTVVPKTSSHSFYGQRDYYLDQPVVTAFYRQGITNALTAEADVQADDRLTMAGGGFMTQTVAGLIAGELSLSESYSDGLGYAAKLVYSYDKFNWFDPYKTSFSMLGEWRSSNFSTVQTYVSGGVYAPSYNGYLSAGYTQQVPYDVRATLSVSYYLLLDAGGSNGHPGNRWDTDFSLTRKLWDDVSGSLSVGYGQDGIATNQTCCLANRDGFRTFVRVSWIPDAHTSAWASYDSRAESGHVTYNQSSETTGVGSWVATVDASTDATNDSGINASASYVANRAEVSVSHNAGLAGIGYNGAFNPSFTEERTSLSVGSSLVYADGAWGAGRPVSGGFALVTPHQSLEGSPVVVGAADQSIAESGMFGPAVVPNVKTYSQTRLPYDAPGAPTGYDLGSATYDLKAPYKAGYNLQAGSAYTVTAMGTLLDTEGQPLRLLAGTAREANKENGHKVELFTNRVGRFGALGLAPGHWIVEMPTEPEPSRYVLDIPEGLVGLHNAGELRPSGSGEQQRNQEQKPALVAAGKSHDAS